MVRQQRTSMGIILAAALAATGIVAACADGPAAPPSVGPLAVSPAHQWAGGTVTLEAEGLADVGDISVTVDGEPYPESLTASAGDSLTVRLPPTANGPVEIAARSGDQTLGRATVETYGFERMRSYPVKLEKYVKPWPLAAGFGLVGTYELPAPRTGGIAVLELGTGAVVRFDNLHRPDCRVPIVGLEPGHLVVCTEVYDPPAREYRMSPEPTLLRELPFPLVLFYNELLSPGVGFHGFHHFVQTFVFDDTSAVIVADVRTEEVHGVEILAGHDRAMVESRSTSVPVFETSTGALAYELDPGIGHSSHSVASSEERGRFYLVSASEETPSRNRLLGVDAETGAVVDSLVYEDGGTWDEVEYLPERDVVLLSVPLAERLLVLDADTFSMMGEIDLAGRYPEEWWDSAIFVEDDSDLGYIVFIETESEQSTPAIEFRIPPTGPSSD